MRLQLQRSALTSGVRREYVCSRRIQIMSEAHMVRNVGRACGKIILSGNTANRFGKRALAVPVEMYITCIWNETDEIPAKLRILWPGHRGNDIWLRTARKIVALIEVDIGPVAGKTL